MGTLQGSTLFHPAHGRQQFGSGDGGHGAAADPGEDVSFQSAEGPTSMTGGPVGGVLSEPFPCYGFETIG